MKRLGPAHTHGPLMPCRQRAVPGAPVQEKSSLNESAIAQENKGAWEAWRHSAAFVRSAGSHLDRHRDVMHRNKALGHLLSECCVAQGHGMSSTDSCGRQESKQSMQAAEVPQSTSSPLLWRRAADTSLKHKQGYCSLRSAGVNLLTS